MKIRRVLVAGLLLVALSIAGDPGVSWGQENGEEPVNPELLERYTSMMDELRTELTAKIPKLEDEKQVDKFLASDKLDSKLVKYVVLHEATPKGLALFAQQGKEQERLIKELLSDTDLMKQMLVADGASRPKNGPAQYGQAMKVYADIQNASRKARDGVLQLLAVATALETSRVKDPVERYLHFEKAYLNGELDPGFPTLDTWNLRFVVNGNESLSELTWGREMLRNYRPDHIYTSNEGGRYTGVVRSNVQYGSSRVKFDRPELLRHQNILMNGGICGRRAFFGQYICRAFGVPSIKRPSRAHGALARWTSKGWAVNLGPRWGSGWTDTIYSKDRAFLASSQARKNPEAYLQVKRAQWIGDLVGEKRKYGGSGDSGSWNGVSLLTQERLIKELKAVTLAPVDEEFGEADDSTIAEKIMAAPVTEADKKISYNEDGTIEIPAVAYSTPADTLRGVAVMKSFLGGQQVYLPGFGRKGVNLLRGGSEKSGPDNCSSGRRIRSGGMGNYANWGFRVAVTPAESRPVRELKLDLGNGVTMEFVYIKPGKFVMGGERTTDSRFDCAEVPKHEVEITKGYYLGKTEVTRAQYEVLGNPEKVKEMKDGNLPRGSIGIEAAEWFCKHASEKTGHDVRLPTEAEWEYAVRAGTRTKWFFGDDPAKLGGYAWFGENSGGKNKFHPVGQKKPNPWGLYDVYGNMWERVADVYDKEYFAKSPKQDPTGPSQDPQSCVDYTINVPEAGKYELTARVVTMNYEQILNVAANDDPAPITMVMPFTCGKWQYSEPAVLNLKQGENILKFSRTQPPQYGMAVKSYTLKPLN